jgi:hypothetical protein
MQPYNSLPCSQETATDPHKSYPSTYFLKSHINIILPPTSTSPNLSPPFNVRFSVLRVLNLKITLLLNMTAFHLLSRRFLAQFIFTTLKMEAIFSSETLVDSTTRRYIPEDGTLQV